MRKLAYKFSQWMQGRYGNDELSKFMFIAAMVCFVLSIFKYLRIFYVFSILLLCLSCARCYSKNIYARQREREIYLRIKTNVTDYFTLCKRMWNDRRTHKYFKCPQCKARLRVPKNRGKIEVTCPQCHAKTVKKT